MTKLTHILDDGSIKMVEVANKPSTARVAIVKATVHLNANTFALLQKQALPKGDVLTTAKIAGIMAAKKTAELIPLCHPVFLSFIDVNFEIDTPNECIHIIAEARTTDKTGIEMEAIIAAQVTAATIYDMCKAVQRDIIIDNCRLVHKSGGRSGEYNEL